jgi:hypothetical protein
MPRYRLVKDMPTMRDGPTQVTPTNHPADGFANATEAAAWANAHDLDWRWYIQEMPA